MFRKLKFCVVCCLTLALMTSVASAELIAYWPLDGDATDASGNGYDGILEGNVTFAEGAVGDAADFDAASYINCGDVPIGSSITVACWVMPRAIAQNWSGIVSKHNPEFTEKTFWFGQHSTNGAVRAAYFPTDPSANAVNLDTGVVLANGQWTHIAVTQDGNIQRIYIDGVEAAVGPAQGNGVVDRGGEFRIGKVHTTEAAANFWFNGLIDDVQLYDEALPASEIQALMGGLTLEQAGSPVPGDKESDVLRDGVILAWNAGDYAVTHDVYFGTDFTDVNEATINSPEFMRNQADTFYPLERRLELGRTYYWRIDEVNDLHPEKRWKGAVWEFTIEPEGVPLAVVEAKASSTLADFHNVNNTINGSGITIVDGNEVHSASASHMWKSGFLPTPASAWLIYSFDKAYSLHELLIWNANEYGEQFQGLGIKDISIATSLDGETWDTLGDFIVPQGPGAEGYPANPPISLEGVKAQHVKILIHSNWGSIPQFSVSEVKFSYIPVRAREPQPDNGATVDPDVVLSWREGRQAVSHTLSMGTDPNNLDMLVENIDNPYDTTELDLQLGQTYTWTISEVNDNEAVSEWVSDPWTFTTVDSFLVDDFESYNDDWGNMVFQTWTDGLGWEDPEGNTGPSNGSGSGVGHWPPPTMETTIVRSGQSMLIAYGLGNVGDSYVTCTDLGGPTDWSKHGLKSLSLWFHGDAANLGGQLYVKVNNKRFDYQGAATDIQAAHWFPFTIDLTGITKVDALTIGVEGGSGTIYIDDIYLTPNASELVTGSAPGDDDPNLVAYYKFEGNPDDSKGNYPGTAVGEPVYDAGKFGQAIALDGVDDHIENTFEAEVVWSAYSVSLWAKTDVLGQAAASSLFNNNSSSPDFQIDIDGSDNYRYAGGQLGIMGPVSSDWVHLGVSCDGSKVDLYYNGVYVGTLAAADTNFGQIAVGINRAMNKRFSGMIDDVRVYNRALSYAEVLGLAERTAPAYK